jgi:uncharacterized protein (TIGR00299 family) protein
VTRNGFAATRCHVEVADSTTHRTWRDIAALLASAPLPDGVRARAHATFERLAVAEAEVHGTSPDEVHFHEVGALDAIADVVGVCAGLEHLGLSRLVVSPVAVGSGSVRGAHGSMPVPPPAVAALLRGRPSYAGPAGAPAMELCTPTGAALLTANATGFGPQPAMTVEAVGVGAGGRDPQGHTNVLRLFVGAAADAAPHGTHQPLLVETNVDDLDPRLWPNVIAALLAAGASDAWLSPIVMKKGRPAHVVSALVDPAVSAAVMAAMVRETGSLGVRGTTLERWPQPRTTVEVDVDGYRLRTKVAAGRIKVEHDDAVRVARRTGLPLREVLARAESTARSTVEVSGDVTSLMERRPHAPEPPAPTDPEPPEAG